MCIVSSRDNGSRTAQPSDGILRDVATRLLAAIERYDEAGVHAMLDESFVAFGLEAVLRDVILPTLKEVGLRWEQGNSRSARSTSPAI